MPVGAGSIKRAAEKAGKAVKEKPAAEKAEKAAKEKSAAEKAEKAAKGKKAKENDEYNENNEYKACGIGEELPIYLL